jgi:hypothetical protein
VQAADRLWVSSFSFDVAPFIDGAIARTLVLVELLG